MQDLVIISYIFNIVLVIVTTVYVILTWKLVKSANQQVQASREQVQTSKDIHKAIKIERLNIYKTTLLAIKSELYDHDSRTETLKKELEVIHDNVENLGDLITNRTSIIYDISFLDKCRDKILEYEDPNFDFFQLYSFYINRSDEINKNLSFEKIISMKQFFENAENFKNAVNGYFADLNKQVERLQELRADIIKKLETEVINYLPSYLMDELVKKNKL